MDKIYLPVREQKCLDALKSLYEKNGGKSLTMAEILTELKGAMGSQRTRRAVRSLRKEGIIRVVVPPGRAEEYYQGYRYELVEK